MNFNRIIIFVIVVMACRSWGAGMGADTELFLIDESILNGQIMPAIVDFLERDDASAARRLVDEAMSGQQFKAAITSKNYGDRTTAEYFADGSKQLIDGEMPNKILDDDGETIRDPQLIRRRQTERLLSRFLLLFLCAWSNTGTQTIIPLSRMRQTCHLRLEARQNFLHAPTPRCSWRSFARLRYRPGILS